MRIEPFKPELIIEYVIIIPYMISKLSILTLQD